MYWLRHIANLCQAKLRVMSQTTKGLYSNGNGYKDQDIQDESNKPVHREFSYYHQTKAE
jgi:hypothetical protein